MLPTISNACNNVTRGMTLAQQLDEHKMWLPSTTPDISRSHAAEDQGTFKPGAKSRPTRIDYVALSDDIQAKVGSARTMKEIVMRNKGEDNIPAGVEIRCGNGGGNAPFRMRRVRYDRTKPKMEPFKSDYKEQLGHRQLVKYEAEPTSHQYLLANAL